MLISIYSKKYKIKVTSKLHSDSNCDDVMEAFAKLLFAYGYSLPSIIESMHNFVDVYKDIWSYDKAEPTDDERLTDNVSWEYKIGTEQDRP